MTALGDFLKAAARDRRPWNCSTLPADWCIALGHPDFAAEWRPFEGELQAPDIGADALVGLWREAIGDALPDVTEAEREPGDIAVLSLGPLETGAIWTGERWVIRREKGLHFSPPEHLHLEAAWRP
jgi:hypothetical protein